MVRLWLLAAKAAVIGALTLVAGEVVAFASFALVQAVLSGKHLSVSLSHPGVPGAVLAGGLLNAASNGEFVRHVLVGNASNPILPLRAAVRHAGQVLVAGLGPAGRPAQPPGHQAHQPVLGIGSELRQYMVRCCRAVNEGVLLPWLDTCSTRRRELSACGEHEEQVRINLSRGRQDEYPSVGEL